jgi:hypothetical protein
MSAPKASAFLSKVLHVFLNFLHTLNYLKFHNVWQKKILFTKFYITRNSKNVITLEINHEFLGTFAKLRKATIIFVTSVGPSVCPHGTIRLSLDGFSRNLLFEYFSKNCWEYWSFIKIGEEWRLLYMKTNTNFWSSLVQFFLEWQTFRKTYRENQNPHFMFNDFLSKTVQLMKKCQKIL